MHKTRKKRTRLEVVAVVTVKVDIRHVNAYQPRNTRLLLSSGGALLFPHQHPRYVLPLRLLLQPVGLVLSEGAYTIAVKVIEVGVQEQGEEEETDGRSRRRRATPCTTANDRPWQRH